MMSLKHFLKEQVFKDLKIEVLVAIRPFAASAEAVRILDNLVKFG